MKTLPAFFGPIIFVLPLFTYRPPGSSHVGVDFRIALSFGVEVSRLPDHVQPPDHPIFSIPYPGPEPG